ncbi:hypothetical protein, partial [Cloacibacillus evryensis]|uniref:hypothetical protein n=1 Tax=Cloacibacillus evryensis TaxID=508460 RepID=UPI003AB223CB
VKVLNTLLAGRSVYGSISRWTYKNSIPKGLRKGGMPAEIIQSVPTRSEDGRAGACGFQRAVSRVLSGSDFVC